MVPSQTENGMNETRGRKTHSTEVMKMVMAKQLNLFAFESVENVIGPTWLENYDGEHVITYRMDAEAIVEDLNRMPSGKGSWLRCLEVDHARSYEYQFKGWDACIWFQRGI